MKPERTIDQRKRMCTEKRLYTTEQSARSAAKGSSRTFGKRFRAYLCPNCTWWQLGGEGR